MQLFLHQCHSFYSVIFKPLLIVPQEIYPAAVTSSILGICDLSGERNRSHSFSCFYPCRTYSCMFLWHTKWDLVPCEVNLICRLPVPLPALRGVLGTSPSPMGRLILSLSLRVPVGSLWIPGYSAASHKPLRTRHHR